MSAILSLSLVVAIVGLYFDAYTTRAGLLMGIQEGNPIRLLAVKLAGINGGTYGLTGIIVVAMVLTNLYGHYPKNYLAASNFAVGCVSGLLAWMNYKKVRYGRN